MGFDRSERDHEPDEPEEYDPEAEFRDPDSDSLTIPDIDAEPSDESNEHIGPPIPEVSTDEMDVPPELAKTFWAVVLVVNAALLALSVGLLLLLFEGPTSHGGWLVAGGIVLLGFAVHRYRSYDGPESSGPTPDRAEEATDDRATERATNGGQHRSETGEAADADPDPDADANADGTPPSDNP
ncbi:hypothetical protein CHINAEXTREME_17590 [Halobiforma lacisalsi AJ5]|uniref:DUF7322 domain-containing protein n=1 Tax=Natronobacterium lacisalsi AJ5 TaxID=358396 RepID=M0LHW7_NATLA|nr:hypothetical protein [Halobiforma lacisalsi]APX00135.1 hypothetical protein CHINAEXTREME_17590 [Halobiforma lacisalsi AJ5]EMA31585.1 hypothetical protein C445_13922 [Halobiforma lacisalsi AJ5]